MTDTKLIERLRDKAIIDNVCAGWPSERENVCTEAAEALTAAQKRIDELEGAMCVSWTPRGIGSNWNIPDLRTGEETDDLRPDCSGFVRSKTDGHLAVAIFGGNAYLDYRPSEPRWIQVKVSCDRETLSRLIALVSENDNVLTPDIVRAALQGSE